MSSPASATDLRLYSRIHELVAAGSVEISPRELHRAHDVAAQLPAGSCVYIPSLPGLPLSRTVKVVLPEPLGVEEVEYRSVLVGFEDDEAFSPEMVATAVKLASKRRRGIHVPSPAAVRGHGEGQLYLQAAVPIA